MREAEPTPEMLATLDAVDATLAGEPVDPAFAEIAELALLVRAERPVAREDFARTLNARVSERFQPAPTRSAPPKRRRSWLWTLAPAGGLVAAVVVAVVVVSSGGVGSSSSSSGLSISKRPVLSQGHSSASRAAPRVFGANRGALTPSPGLRLPNAGGRKLTQSSQLTLGVVPNRIETAAQEVFNVVGEQNGFVDNSQVTAEATGGYAHLQLSVPAVNLPQTMSALSTLAYTRVLQRTDNVEDITRQYRNAVRHHDKKQIKALKRQIAYSQISVDLQAYKPPPPHRRPHHSAFIPTAARTALHVLEVVAGVSLIALAVLLPLALVAALLWWIRDAMRRRRRERALDAA